MARDALLRRPPLSMISVILIGFSLLAATVCVNALGLAALLRYLQQTRPAASRGIWPITWLLIRTAWALIAIWAAAYLLIGAMPDAESAFYFSGVTYTTVGYGDLVLPLRWRMLGPLEGMTGILMCGLSGAFFFAVVVRTFGFKANDQGLDMPER
jgi:hypothetical protein